MNLPLKPERTLLLGLALTPALWPSPALALPDHTSYDVVLGQPSKGVRRINHPDERSLSYPSEVAIDRTHTPNHLYLADLNNGRVLAWRDIAQFRAGASPDLILGQPDRYTVGKFRKDARAISSVGGIAVDKDGTLWASDASSGRVLGFRWPFDPGPSQTDNVTADVVIGQPDFTTGFLQNGCNGGYLYSGVPGDATDDRLCSPAGIHLDPDGNLYVADANNHRVVVFKAPLTTNAKAALVFGQDSLKGPVGGRQQQCNKGAVPATPTATSLCRPSNVFVHQDGMTRRLYVTDAGNNRVLAYDDPLNNQTANRVFGQPNMTSGAPAVGPSGLTGPSAVSVDDRGVLWISDAGHRVLGFVPPWNGTAGFGAAYVLGQLDTNGKEPNQGVPGRPVPPPTAASLFAPRRAVFDAEGRMLLPDQSNHRVLGFVAYTSASPAASFVYGQPDFLHGYEGQTKANGMAYPVGVAVDRPDPASRPGEPMHVYVVDSYNNRVLGWWDLGDLKDGKPADLVIGQRSPQDYACNMGRGTSNKTLCWPRGATVDARGDLWVADSWNHRVLRFPRPFSGPRQPTADLVLGQPSFLSSLKNGTDDKTPSASGLWHPSDIAVAQDGTVWVADRDNDRVVGFQSPYRNGMNATRLLLGNVAGAGFNVSGCPNRPNGGQICAPTGISLDAAGNLWVAERDNNRVALYKTAPPDPMSPLLSPTPLAVLGQANATSVAQNRGAPNVPSAVSLRNPEAVSVEIKVMGDGSRVATAIVVADTGNNRVLAYPAGAGTGAAATLVIGQAAMDRRTINRDDVFLETPETVAQGLWAPAGVLALPEALLIVDSGTTSTFSTRNGLIQPTINNTGNNRMILLKGPGFPAPSTTPWSPPDGGLEETPPDMTPAEEPDLRSPDAPPDMRAAPQQPDLRQDPDPPIMQPQGCSCQIGALGAKAQAALPIAAFGLIAGLVLTRRRRPRR
jgi:sugar lactone lactonase YvrE